MSAQLSHCPFCGDTDTRTKNGHADITFIVCYGCGAVVSFAPFLIGDAAINAYNQRSERKEPT